jgi:hypothetical protein
MLNRYTLLSILVMLLLATLILLFLLLFITAATAPQSRTPQATPSPSVPATADPFVDQMRRVCASLVEKAAEDAERGRPWVRTPSFDARIGVCDAGLAG